MVFFVGAFFFVVVFFAAVFDAVLLLVAAGAIVLLVVLEALTVLAGCIDADAVSAALLSFLAHPDTATAPRIVAVKAARPMGFIRTRPSCRRRRRFAVTEETYAPHGEALMPLPKRNKSADQSMFSKVPPRSAGSVALRAVNV